MGVLNRDPELGQMFDKLDERLRALEAVKRFTIPVIPNYTKIPAYPQSGDCFIDASTGYIYVFLVLAGDGFNGVTSATSMTIATGSTSFTTNIIGSYAVGQPVNIYQTTNRANFMTGFITLVSGTSIQVNVKTIGGSGTFSNWTLEPTGAWRQIATYADLISRNVYFATSSGGSATVSASSLSGGGTGSAVAGPGIGQGGTGYVLAPGYQPH